MKLIMTLLVRDEADIIAANIDYHRAVGVDYFVATDNLSSDGTTEILRRYERKGLLHYIREESDDYSQHQWVTRMARMAAADHGADWVINNDADEFWWPDDKPDLKSFLQACDPTIEALTAVRTNFVPLSFATDGFFADQLTIRESVSSNALGQPLPGKVCHRAIPDITIAQGNHSVSRSGRVLPVFPAAFSILHFPVRSYPQLENKIAKGGAAYERNTDLNEGVGATWRELYATWKRGGLAAHFDQLIPGPEELANGLESGRFVRDERLKLFLETLYA